MDEYGDGPVNRPPAPGQGFAIASLVLGLVGLAFPLTAFLAIIFGAIALKQMKHVPGEAKSMAKWGLGLGIFISVGLIAYIIHIVLVIISERPPPTG
jgi:hypothetical protein